MSNVPGTTALLNSATVASSVARVKLQLACQLFQRGGADRRKYRWHEAADRLGIDDHVADLVGLAGDQPSPDGIALRPEVLAFVIEAFGVRVDDDAKRDRIDAGGNAAVPLRRAGIDGDHVPLRRVADGFNAGIEQDA